MEQKEINKNVEILDSLSSLISEIIKERQKEKNFGQWHALSIEDLSKIENKIDDLLREIKYLRDKKA